MENKYIYLYIWKKSVMVKAIAKAQLYNKNSKRNGVNVYVRKYTVDINSLHTPDETADFCDVNNETKTHQVTHIFPPLT